MIALRNVVKPRFRGLNTCDSIARLPTDLGFIEEYTCVVSVVQYDEPWPITRVGQPVVEQLEHVCFRVLPSVDSQYIQNVAHALIKADYVARMYP
jgi:hypothetical protein